MCCAALRCAVVPPTATPMIMPSSGVHVTLPDYYSPDSGEEWGGCERAGR